MTRTINDYERWGQTLPRCDSWLLTSLCVVIFIGACTGDVPTETSNVREAVVSRTAADEARIVETLVQGRYAAYRATLTPAETAREDARVARTGASGAHLFVQWSGRQTVKSLWAYRMRIPTSAPAGASDSDRAARFLQDHRALFGLNPSVALNVHSARFDASLPGTIVRYEEQLLGRPVFGASLLVHVGPSGDIEWLTGHIVPESAVSPATATLTAADAARIASGDAATGVLGWFDPEVIGGSAGPVRLAWRVRAGSGVGVERVFVDALTGAELARRSLVRADQHNETFFDDGTFVPGGSGALQFDDQCHTSGDATCPPGWCSGGVCTSPAPLGTSAAVRDRQEIVFDYLFDRFGRDSWDNAQCGTPGHGCTDASLHRMRAVSDYRPGTCLSRWFPYDHAVHPAQIAMAVGHGNSLDAISHEWIHGVTDSTEPDPFGGGLQAAAMEEAFPDIFAQLTERYSAGVTDWIQPTGFGAPCTVVANLANPPSVTPFCDPLLGNRPAPDHWSNYRYDCRGAHWARTLAGKIGHLMGREPSEGTEVHWGVPVQGIGELEASTVWYKVLTGGLASATTHTELRNALYDMCGNLDPDLYAGCIGSIDAVGLWSSDTDVGWNVDGAVAAQYFRTSGVDRRWVFYKEPGIDQLRYRYRTCWLFDTCSWSSPVVLDPATSGPAATTYGGFLWVCFRAPGVGDVWCDRINSTGSKLIGPDPIGSRTDGPPSLVHYGGALYLGYERSGTFRWRRYTTAGGWEPEQVEWAIGAEPALASPDEDIVPAGGPLWVVYRRTGDSRVAYRSFNSATSTWDPEVLAGPPDLDAPPVALDRPSAVVHKGRLHVAARYFCGLYGPPCSGSPIYYMSCDLPCTAATDWTRWVPQDGTWSSQQYFHLENQGDVDARLYLWHRPTGSSNLSWRHKSSE